MSDTKAGTMFTCVCCGDDEAEHNATYDKCLKGPVCPDCNFNLKCGSAWLKHMGIFPCGEEVNA